MVFVKPSVVTSQTGSYNFKTSMGSVAENYIDNSFPKILDKTGDTVAGGGGITGEIDISGAGQIKLLSGGQITSGSGTVQIQGTRETISGAGAIFVTAAGTVAIDSTGNLNSIGSIAISGGSVVISGSGTLQSPGASIQINDSGNITFQAARTRTRYQRLAPAYLPTGWTTGTANSSFTPSISGSGTTNSGNGIILPIDFPLNGATLHAVTVYIIVNVSHATLPSTFPSIQVFRTDGDTVQTLGSAANYTDTFGTPGSVAAYYNGGISRGFTVTTTTNNMIDTSNWLYYVNLIDEAGGGAISGNMYTQMSVSYTNNTSYGNVS